MSNAVEPVRIGGADVAWEPVRSVYRPARRADPIALAGALAIVATVTGAIAMLNAPKAGHHPRALTVFQMELSPPPPPDRPPPPPPSTARMQPVSPPAITAPVPEVMVPATQPGVPDSPTVPPAPLAAPAAPASAGPSAPLEPAAAGPIDGGDLSAKMISAPPPGYPEECRRRREQGMVKLSVLVGLDGRAEDVSVAASSGSSRLDRAALHAVRHWRWSPVRHDGTLVMVRGFVTIPFVLRT